MSVVKSSMNLGGFDGIEKKLRGKFAARVGIIGKGNARPDDEGMGNAEIGMIQEFGSTTRGIPPRSFLRVPLIEHKSKILKFMASPAIQMLLKDGKIEEIYKRVGVMAEAIVQVAFESRGYGKWQPNAPYTVAKKGSDAPLIDTGELRKSITSEVVRVGK